MGQPLRAGIHTKDGARYLAKYLSPEVRATHKFALHSAVTLPSGHEFEIRDVVVRDEQYHAVIQLEIPVSKFDKPLISSRVGYHPETYETSVLCSIVEQLRAIASNCLGDEAKHLIDSCNNFTMALPVLLPNTGPMMVADVQKVARYRAKADFVILSDLQDEVFFISHKAGHGQFPSYGGVIAAFKDSPVLKEFQAWLASYITIERGIETGTLGMNLVPSDPLHLDIIKSVLFGTAHASGVHGANNVNVIMHGEVQFIETDGFLTLKSEMEIHNDGSFDPEAHPLQMVVHRLAGRSDLGFHDTHLMVVPANSRRLKGLLT